MKNIIGLLCLMLSIQGFAQTTFEKTQATRPGQKVQMEFKWPELVNIKTWDKNEIKIVASVSINNGRNDDAFDMIIKEKSNVLYIQSAIKNFKNLHKMIMISRNGEQHFFNTSDWNAPEVQKFLNERGKGGHDYSSNGVIMDIEVSMTIPRNIDLEISSEHTCISLDNVNNPMVINTVHGKVEADFSAINATNPISISSTHGLVDLSLSRNAKANFNIHTNHGEVYSDLGMQVEKPANASSRGPQSLRGKFNGGGATFELASEHGNIYLRKKID